IHKNKESVSEAINSLNNIEMVILYLFYFHGKSVREISKMTNLSKEKIYYRVSRIKVKLGMKTTRKLPALLRIFFNQTIEPEY
ncbi:TPA: sigma factor-like helix-turn-helix DNA-binding protein, partial [Escherichia coli]